MLVCAPSLNAAPLRRRLQLSTPRELMLFMTELLARIEAHPDNQLSAQDMEIAVSKALEQAV